MARFENRNAPGIQIAIWLSVALVLVIDLRTPLGVSVWLLYLIPIVLCSFGFQSGMPLAVSAVSTVLIALGFFLKPSGVVPWLAAVDRILGLSAVWTIGITGHQLLKRKLVVAEQNW